MNALDKLRTVCNRSNVDYELFKDKIPLKTADTGAAEYGINLSEADPTLIIKIEEGIMATIIRGDTKISFKKLKEFLKIIRISLANPEAIYNLIGYKIGYVSLINEGLKTLMDKKTL